MEFQELLQKQLTKVPPQVRHYLESDAYPQVMRSVIEKYNLHIDTASKIETETTLLLIGLVAPAKYETALVQNGGLSKEQASAITKEMNEQVFKPLVESYKKPAPVHTNAFADEPAVQKQPEPAPEEVSEPEIPTQIPVETPTAPVEEKKIEKKYAIDPYREPIE
tara:strand:+ start:9838 stop:10332 length:495 start_codon:yes stop_codon:yes gene_type:complete